MHLKKDGCMRQTVAFATGMLIRTGLEACIIFLIHCSIIKMAFDLYPKILPDGQSLDIIMNPTAALILPSMRTIKAISFFQLFPGLRYNYRCLFARFLSFFGH